MKDKENIFDAKNVPKALYKLLKKDRTSFDQEYLDALIGGQVVNPNDPYVKKIERLLGT